MQKKIAVGIQDFSEIILNDYFYVDKTHFIKEWWENGDAVTLITRPRRFGKTLTMSMVEYFFSANKKNSLFNHLCISKERELMQLQNTYPVINLTFSDVKNTTFEDALSSICEVLTRLYEQNHFLLTSGLLVDTEADYFKSVTRDMSELTASKSIGNLSRFLHRYYGKKPIILLDEYDTPMQEAYVNGYWDKMSAFMRSFFNSTFKANEYMGRALLTGITHVGKESLFSDFNNPKIVTASSGDYADAFGFTEEEVFDALDTYSLSSYSEAVKAKYDGFVFGGTQHIYNPWSILNFLRSGETESYWANTSSNAMVGSLLRKADAGIKQLMETLLRGESITVTTEEHIVFQQLEKSPHAIWSFLLAGGYLKLLQRDYKNKAYTLTITNEESEEMFRTQIMGWFANEPYYNDFVTMLLQHNLPKMNRFLNELTASVISSFDSGRKPSDKTPERFYHGLVLGLLVDLRKTHVVTSNRESGFGRYDVVIEPKDKSRPAFIFEFKVQDEDEGEKTLQDTVRAALVQIEEKKYEQQLLDHGFTPEQIYKYGFAFQGKEVLIGDRP